MDTKPVPQYEEFPVRNIDVLFKGFDVPQTWVLLDTDTFDVNDTELVIKFAKNGQVIVVHRMNVLFYSVLRRLHRRQIADGLPGAPSLESPPS